MSHDRRTETDFDDGLTGAGPTADESAFSLRLEAWRRSYRVETGEQEWLLRQMVVRSVRADRCRCEAAVVRAYEASATPSTRKASVDTEASRLPSMLGGRISGSLEPKTIVC